MYTIPQQQACKPARHAGWRPAGLRALTQPSAQALHCVAEMKAYRALQKEACVCLQVSSTRLCARLTCAAHLQLSLKYLWSREPASAHYLPSQAEAELAAELAAELGTLQIPLPA